MNVNMTQEQLVRELRSGLPIHTHPGDLEPRLSPLSVSCVHAIMSTAANVIETLAADRKSAMQEASEFLEELNELHAKVPRWISVEERLPEKGVFVVVYYGHFIGNLMDVYMWDGECWRSSTGYLEDAENITHWMPLPEPPKEE